MEKQQTAMRAMQIEMAMKQRQAMMAMQNAIARERLKYYSVFAGTICSVLPIVAFKTHNPKLLGPLLPISLSWAYQYDMAYGTLIVRA